VTIESVIVYALAGVGAAEILTQVWIRWRRHVYQRRERAFDRKWREHRDELRSKLDERLP
jgi:hypothetical protein